MDELIERREMLVLLCCEDSSLGGVEVRGVSCLFPDRNDPSSTFLLSPVLLVRVRVFAAGNASFLLRSEEEKKNCIYMDIGVMLFGGCFCFPHTDFSSWKLGR